MKPLRQSTLDHSRYICPPSWICRIFSFNSYVLLSWRRSELNSSKAAYSHVASWADRYLDSGVSLTMDMAESAGSDYDSDDSRSSRETVHHSYSYIPSDAEVRARARFNQNGLKSGREAILTCFFSGIRDQIWSCTVCDAQQNELHSIVSTETFVCIFCKGKIFISCVNQNLFHSDKTVKMMASWVLF